jgi:hypothetical protein
MRNPKLRQVAARVSKESRSKMKKSDGHLEDRGDRPERNPGRVRWNLACAIWKLNAIGNELSAGRGLIFT